MKIQQPLVCICIPNYNNEKTIAETLDSLLNQTYKNIIIKIFDNSSTDKSRQIIEIYASRYPNIHVFFNETNVGGEANFTKCIQNLEGEYGAVFHADDVYESTIIETQVRFLQTYRDCGAVATHAYTINRASLIVGERFVPPELRKCDSYIFENQLDLFRMVLKYGNFITCPSVMGHTDIFREKISIWNGGEFKTSADLDVWLRFAEVAKFGFIAKPLMKYRLSETSYSYNLARMRTEPHDLFLVLDSYLSKPSIANALTSTDKDHYAFLLFKDRVNRSINLFIQGVPVLERITLMSPSIIKVAIGSKHNLAIYFAGLLIKFISPLRHIKPICKLLYHLRFCKL